MILEEFTDEFITKVVSSACAFFNIPLFYKDDCEQAAYLAAIELRKRLQDRNDCNLLSQRNIYLSVRRAIAVTLRLELREHGTPMIADEFADSQPSALDYSDRELLAERLNLCSKRQKEVVHYYFWKNLTQEEIAEKMNVSQQMISGILKRAIKRMQAEKPIKKGKGK